MSACNVLKQRDAVHLMVDGAAYDESGVLVGFPQKCVTIPVAHAAIATLGPSGLARFLASELALYYRSFDEIVQDAEQRIPEIAMRFRDLRIGRNCGSEVYVIGWSERSGPQAYVMHLNDGEVTDRLADYAAASNRQISFNKLSAVDLTASPAPDPVMLQASGFRLPSHNDKVVAEVDLLHLLEVQRRRHADGRYWVGGHALLTSVDKLGVSQRVVHRWSEDTLGNFIVPQSIDWKAWRTAREAAVKPANVKGGALMRFVTSRREPTGRQR